MKYLFTLCVAMICSVSSYAQYDLNGDGKETVADVSSVVNRVLGNKDDSITSISVYKNGKFVGSFNNTSTNTYTIKYNISHFADGHEYVDLGLPSGTLWAKTNIGADTETDAGLYFAWGVTNGFIGDTNDGYSFNWTNYSLCDGSSYALIKYCTDSSLGTVDNNTELLAADDAATVNWGSNWQMPSYTQQNELRTSCTWTWDSTNKGYKVTGTNGNSIFLPAASYRVSNSLENVGSGGYYWSRSLSASRSDLAYGLEFYSSRFYWRSDERSYGFSVRPVRVKK